VAPEPVSWRSQFDLCLHVSLSRFLTTSSLLEVLRLIGACRRLRADHGILGDNAPYLGAMKTRGSKVLVVYRILFGIIVLLLAFLHLGSAR
jgi:hypothetical protein